MIISGWAIVYEENNFSFGHSIFVYGLKEGAAKAIQSHNEGGNRVKSKLLYPHPIPIKLQIPDKN